MSWLQNLPVQRKLDFAILITSVVALIVAGVIFTAIEYFDCKNNLIRSVVTLGQIMAKNSTAALAVVEQKAATQNLAALQAEPQIVGAALYDNNGNIIASFAPNPALLLKTAGPSKGVRLEQGYIIDVQPVVENSQQLGTLYLQASMNGIYRRIRDYAMIVAVVLVFSVALAWQIASVLRHGLAQPILELAGTADAAARRLAAIVESSDDAIVGKDLNGTITSWNHGAERLFGYSAQEILGKSVMIIIPRDRAAEETTILERLRRNESIKYDETVRQRKDGTLIEISLTISPIKDNKGQIVGASKIARDISERKRALRQANFIHQLSHQLTALTDPGEILRTVSRELGVHMKVDRCFFCVTDDDSHGLVQEDWARDGLASLNGIHQRLDFGTPELWSTLASGPLAIDDKSSHPLIRNQGVGYDSCQIAAHLTVPFVRNGKWISTLVATTAKPRSWSSEEIVLMENVLARAWPMVERAQSQLELQQSERRQRELMQALPIACFTVDEQGRLSFFNDAAKQLWKQEPELGDTNWFSLLSASGIPLSFEQSPFGEALKEKRPVRGIEGFVLRPDGIKRWVIIHSEPIIETLGHCSGTINVVMDVTEERTAQVKVQKAAEHLSLAIASSNLGDWNWAPFSDRLTISPRTAEILGIPYSTELTRSELRGLLHEEDQNRTQEALLAALKTGSDYDIEYRVLWPDKTIRWVAAKGRPIYGTNGEVQAMVGVVQDVTETKRQAEKLQQLAQEIEAQARLFDAILSNLTDLAYAFDIEGRFIFANKPFQELFGMTMQEIIGKNTFDLGYPPELARQIQSQVQEVISTKRAVRGETMFTAANGRVDDHEYIYNPVLSTEGEVTAVVGSTRMITERKHTENELKRARDEAVAASRAKDDFLAALSHELRTPLNPVLLLASDAANNLELPLSVRKDFELIRKNVDLEARLIDDLLDITRITRGKLLLDQRRCDVHSILKDALSTVHAEILEKNLSVSTEFESSETTVWGDSVRLQQILWNILKNSVKFTPPNGCIFIRTKACEKKLVIEISDTGIGMTPHEIKRIFNAFSQGEHASPGSNLHRFGGLGLGLAISRMLAELHGGEIQAYSDGRDKGSLFVVELPLHLTQTDDKKTTPATGRRSNSLTPFPVREPQSNNDKSKHERRILLVEDHTPTRQTLQQLLRSRQFEVTTAMTAAEALLLAKDNDFILVISDVGLPDRTGFELMSELRTMKPGLLGIALSGYGMEDDLARSQASGFSVHLVKPVTIMMLEEAMENLLISPIRNKRLDINNKS